MTEIKLHTYGEKLIVSEKVTLASGNVNSAELHVILDEAWAAYPNINATFETKEYVEPVEKLMMPKTATEFVCVIPAEVLQHQGVLEIGIRGIASDGETVKTSSYAKYNIVKGASPGNVTLNPTMDLYQQYLSAMDEKTSPLFEAYKADIQAEHKSNMLEMAEDYGRFKSALLEILRPVPLWTNPDPTNTETFATNDEDKTVRFDADLSGYKYYLVEFYYELDERGEPASTFGNVLGHNGLICAFCSEKGVEQTMTIRCDPDSHRTFCQKRFVIEDDGVTFTTVDQPSVLHEGMFLVPYRIMGFAPDLEG